MKKALVLIILMGLVLANPSINEKLSNVDTRSGYEFIELYAYGQEVGNASAISWVASDIAGFSAIGISFTELSAGWATTISAQAIYPNGAAVTGAQTITDGTDLTVLYSSNYLFTLYNSGITRNVTFNFLIAD